MVISEKLERWVKGLSGKDSGEEKGGIVIRVGGFVEYLKGGEGRVEVKGGIEITEVSYTLREVSSTLREKRKGVER